MMYKKYFSNKVFWVIAWALVGVAVLFLSSFQMEAYAQEKIIEIQTIHEQQETIHLYMFGRDGCHFCDIEKEFLDKILPDHPDVNFVYLDIRGDEKTKKLFVDITTANNIPQATPITFVGGEILLGYNSDRTTGKAIVEAFQKAREGKNFPIEAYINLEEAIAVSEENCDNNSTTTPCVVPSSEGTLVDLPFFGVVDVEKFSLFTLSSVLGLIDGFNPCALWVLMTFLLVLMQIGDRKKLLQVAGIFIFAEGVMYYCILTAWYSAWDFVKLDQIVTPLIGFLALGSGAYFLRKWYKSRERLMCDVTDLEQQAKIQQKIHKLVHAPMTIVTVLGIVGVALSVNIIEFACSIGIPQVFTKVLELNVLSFWEHQWYLFLYILGYMVDDIVVFGFAFYGIDKMHASEKYSRLSMLVGGILMIVLGIMFLFFPDALVF